MPRQRRFGAFGRQAPGVRISAVLACIALVLATQLVSSAGADPNGAPTSTAAPAIAGETVVGKLLTASTGTWDGDAPISYAYQWRRCDASGANCADVPAATTETYRLRAGDLAKTLRVAVTATNGSGFSDAVSAASATIDAGGAYPAAVLATADLVHYWRLGESSGSALFDSAGAADATSGNLALGATGALSGDSDAAARFDGSTSVASAPIDLSSTDKVTVEFWLKWSQFANDDDLAMELTSNFNSNDGGFLVDPNAPEGGGKFAVSIGRSSSRNSIGFARPGAGAWHHYALVLDSSAPAADQITPYVDGEPIVFDKLASGTDAGNFANAVLHLMSRNSTSLLGTGDLDELAIYTRKLGPQTVHDHYEAGRGQQPPVALFSVSPRTPAAGQQVTFDATDSTDPDGEIDRYEWDLDGDGTYEAVTNDASISHFFPSAQSVTAGLRVVDNDHATDTATRTVHITAPLGPYATAVLATPSLAHYWRLGESSGATLWDSVGAADATATDVALGTGGALTGDPDTAARFDGSTSVASAPMDLSGTDQATIEFWLNWAAYTNDDDLAMEFTPDFNSVAGGFLVDPNAPQGGGKFAVSLGNGASRNSVMFARPSAGAWHHFAFVLDTAAPAADQIMPYVDGQPVAFDKLASGTGAGSFADSVLHFMSRNSASLLGKGELDDLAIYRSGLHAQAISEHYRAGVGNRVPIASINASPGTVAAGEEVAFDASGSTDPDGEITRYEWDLDGDGSYGTVTSAPYVTHTYVSRGIVEVAVRAVDDNDATDTAARTVQVTSPLGPYSRAVLGTSGLAHYWRLGDDAGTTLSDSAGAADATTSSVGLGVDGALADDDDTAARFDGSSSAASAPVDLSETDEATIEFWLNWAAYANDDALAMEFTPNFNSTAGGFLVDPNAPQGGGKFAVALGDSSSRNGVMFDRPSAGAWHHYAFVLDTGAPAAEQIIPYVDGRIVAFDKFASNTGAGTFADSILHLMSRNSASLLGRGDLDDLAIYTSKLSGQTVLHHFQTGAAIVEPRLNQAPAITGAVIAGSALATDTGEWAGTTPMDFAFQWEACDAHADDCEPVAGATAPTLELTPAMIGRRIRVRVSATNEAGTLEAESLRSDIVAAAAPINVGAPEIVGIPRDGETLTARRGTWTGSRPMSHGYRWRRCDVSGGQCTDSPGGEGAAYVLSDADVGHTIRLVVTSANSAGATSAASTASAVIAPGAPRSVITPTIHGEPRNGQTLTIDDGSWLGTGPLEFAYAWQRCDRWGEDCEDTDGAVTGTYALSGADVGHRLRVRVAASNTAGTKQTVSALSQVVRSRTAPPSLVAAYGLDSGTGTSVQDDSGNGHAGTVGGAAWTEAGRYGRALSFDGTGDGVEVADGLDLDLVDEGTAEAWVKPRDDGYQPILSKRVSTGRPQSAEESFALWADDGQLHAMVDGTVHVAPVAAERWTHVAYAWDAAGARLLLNGRLVDDWEGGGTTVSDSTAPLRIGSDGENSFNGLIDEIRIYGGALTDDAVHADANTRAQTENRAGEPLASFGFEQRSGTSAIDVTGRGRHAAAHGVAWTATGRHGRGASFDDDDDLLEPPAGGSPSGSTYTISVAARPRAQVEHELLASQAGSVAPRFQLFARGSAPSSGPEAHVASGAGTVVLAAPIGLVPRQWSHLTLRRDGDHADLFVDGALVDSAAVEAPSGVAGAIAIGRPAAGDAPAFDGVIDDVRIYDDNLSVSRVADDADAAVDPEAQQDAAPIVALGFEDHTLSVAADASGNGNDASLVGAQFMPGRYGQGVGFEGEAAAAFQDAPSLRLSDGFTVEAWVRPRDRAGAANPIFAQPGADGTAVELDAGSSDRPPSARIGSVQATGIAPLEPGHWTHLAMTWDGATVALYVGESDPIWAAATARPRVVGAPKLGTREDGTGFIGRMDELRVYDQAIPSARVAADRAQPVPEADSALPTAGAGTGTPSGYTFEDFELGTDVLARVNVANGNLVLNPHASVTTGMTLEPVYNSLRPDDGDMGRGMSLSFGRDVQLASDQYGYGRILRGPSGYLGQFGWTEPGPFDPEDETWTAYADNDPLTARVFTNPDNTETVVDASGPRLTFAGAPAVTSVSSTRGAPLVRYDDGDRRWDFNYDSDGLASVYEPESGHRVSVDSADGRVASLSDDTSEYRYQYQGSALTSITRGGEPYATLSWTDGRLTRIKGAESGALDIAYDAVGRVRRIVRTEPDADADATSFAYEPEHTTVARGADETEYEWIPGTLRVTGPDNAPPEINLHNKCAGSNAQVRGGGDDSEFYIYTDGVDDHQPGTPPFPSACFAFDPRDQRSGFRRITMDAFNEWWPAAQHPCPRAWGANLALYDSFPDGNDMHPTNGKPDRDLRVEDCAGNARHYTVHTVPDREGPAPPIDLEVRRDPADGTAVIVSWISGDDRSLPIGRPGSGTMRDEYRFREGENEGWSAWTRAEDNEVVLTNMPASVEVEVRSIDAVDNVGDVARAVETNDPTPSGFEDQDLSGRTGRRLQVDVRFGETRDDSLPAVNLPVKVRGPLERSHQEVVNQRTNTEGEMTVAGLAAGTYAVTPLGGTERRLSVSGQTTKAAVRLANPLAPAGAGGPPQMERDKYCPSNPAKLLLRGEDRWKLCLALQETGNKAKAIAHAAFWPRPPVDPDKGPVAADGTIANAFQHAVWNALLVNILDQMAMEHLFPEALHFTNDIYEYEQQRDSNVKTRQRSMMDLHNNIVGHRFALHRRHEDTGHDWGANGVRLCVRLLRHARARREQGRFRSGTSAWRVAPRSENLVYTDRNYRLADGRQIPVGQAPDSEQACHEVKNYVKTFVEGDPT